MTTRLSNLSVREDQGIFNCADCIHSADVAVSAGCKYTERILLYFVIRKNQQQSRSSQNTPSVLLKYTNTNIPFKV
jgi:hypothetical protein